jgi:hypothetical protein
MNKYYVIPKTYDGWGGIKGSYIFWFKTTDFSFIVAHAKDNHADKPI